MRGSAIAHVLLVCLLAQAVPLAAGEEDTSGAAPRHQPRVTLVLSGGGARGTAHVGVLKVLERLRIPVDFIVGTSMGSIIGGLYATGWSPDEIEELLVTTNFLNLFIDHPDRDDKSFRRKLDDREFLIPLKLRFKGFKPYIPPAALGGQRLENLLRTIEIQSTDTRDFDEFPIPYRAVAADLTTGEAVVLGEGSLATAMRASMSVAGMFTPVVIDGRPLVDGGAAANLPVGIAQELGAGRIIAVDITSPLEGEEELTSLFSILDQMTGFLTVGNRLEDIARLKTGDILIQPELGEISFASFDRAAEAIEIGRAAARAKEESLIALSVSEEEYAAFQARHKRRPMAQTVLSEVRLENSSWVDDEVVRRRVQLAPGEPFDSEVLNDDLQRLSALDYFGTIRPRLDQSEGDVVLTLNTPLKPYGRNSLQFGVNFRDDFEGDSGYAIAVRHQLLAVNRRGGEWQNIFQIGDLAVFDSSFYQPLDLGMKWFVEPGVSFRRWSQSLWVEEEPVAEYRIGVSEARLDAGRVFGRWGEMRVGIFHSDNSAKRRTGVELFPDLDVRDGGARFRFRVDTRDDVVFPERGLEIDATWSESLDGLGADDESSVATAKITAPMTFGRNTIVAGVEGGTLLDGPETINNTFNLGGLLRLSGLGTDELIGSHYGLGLLVYYRELTTIDLGSLSPKLYAGCSIEAGNTWFDVDSISLETLEHSGTVFLGARTPLGPVYFGYAIADGGRSRVYFNIGARF